MTRALTTMAAIGALSLALAACGDEQDGEGTSAPPPARTAPEPIARIENLTGRNTRLNLDSGFLGALEEAGLTHAAPGDATLSEGGVLRLPITGGSVTYYEPGTVSPFVQGVIRHEGSGLSLESTNGTRVELSDLEIDPAASVVVATVSVDGDEVMRNVPLFSLDGSTLEPLRTGAKGAVAVLGGATVKLKTEAARLLNDTFGVRTLQGGMDVGRAKITLDTGA